MTAPARPGSGENPYYATMEAYFNWLETYTPDATGIPEGYVWQADGADGGAFGPPSASAPTASYWRFSTTTTDSDPGSGKFRLNAATRDTATFLYIDDLTQAGVDISNFATLLASGDKLFVQAKDDATSYVRYEISGAATDGTGYWKVPVTVDLAAAGPELGNNDETLLLWNIAAFSGGVAPVAHSSTTGQTPDDHHDEDHAARHASAGADPVTIVLSQVSDAGTAAAADTGDFATATQGTTADTAVQPGDDAATLGSGAASDGQVLTADGLGGAAYETPASGVTDHGLLTGLADDDHTQYHNDTRGDARYPLKAAGGDLSGTLPNPTVAKINGVAVTGTPTSGQVPTATSGTAATWQTPAGGSGGFTVHEGTGTPSSGLGADGDRYIQQDTWAVWTKVSGTWAKSGAYLSSAGHSLTFPSGWVFGGFGLQPPNVSVNRAGFLNIEDTASSVSGANTVVVAGGAARGGTFTGGFAGSFHEALVNTLPTGGNTLSISLGVDVGSVDWGVPHFVINSSGTCVVYDFLYNALTFSNTVATGDKMVVRTFPGMAAIAHKRGNTILQTAFVTSFYLSPGVIANNLYPTGFGVKGHGSVSFTSNQLFA